MKIKYSGNRVSEINYIDLCVGDYFICVYEDGVETFDDYNAGNIYMRTFKGCVNLRGMNHSFKENEKVIKINIEVSWREA